RLETVDFLLLHELPKRPQRAGFEFPVVGYRTEESLHFAGVLSRRISFHSLAVKSFLAGIMLKSVDFVSLRVKSLRCTCLNQSQMSDLPIADQFGGDAIAARLSLAKQILLFSIDYQ